MFLIKKAEIMIISSMMMMKLRKTNLKMKNMMIKMIMMLMMKMKKIKFKMKSMMILQKHLMNLMMNTMLVL